MSVISLKEYAKTHSISYEAVRKQVARFQEELSGHIIENGGQRFLDDAAVEFLDNRRDKNPVVFANDSAKAELEAAKTALEQMKFECAKRDGQIELLKQQLNENFGAAALLEAAEQKAATLERQAIDARKREIETTAALERAEAEVEEAKKVTQALIEQADKAKADAKASEDKAAEIKAKYEKLKNRNLFQRIWNKE